MNKKERDTMSSGNQKIHRETIENMMYGEEKYIKEFAEASISSFTEFKEQFATHLLNRDIENLRRAGHKIKPAALMLNLEELMELYRFSKEQLENSADQSELKDTADKVNDFCEQVIQDFENIIEN